MNVSLIWPLRPVGVFAVLAWVLPPVAVFAPRGMVVLLGAAAGLMILDRGVRHEAGRVFRSPLALVLAGLVAWAAVSSYWSPEPLGSLRLAAKLTGLFAAGLVLISAALIVAREGARPLYRPLIAAGLVVVALLAVEWAGDARVSVFLRETLGRPQAGFPLNLVNRGSAIAALLVWLAATAMARDRGRWRHPAVAPGFLAVAFAVFLGLTMNVLPIVLAVAAGLWLVVWLAYRRSVRIFAVLVAALALAAPLVPLLALDPESLGVEAFTPSLQHRLRMWAYVAERIVDHPLRGWGLDASRWFDAGHIMVQDMRVELLPLHPHNGVLQVWLELGLPGAVLLAALVGLLLLGLARYSVSRAALASGVAVFASFALIAALSYGMWQSWWLATAWLIAAYTVVLAGDRDAAPPPGPTDRNLR